MSESTPPPDSTRTLFELQRLSAEVEELNILLNDSNTIIRSLFQLLRDHNIPVGSTELIKAREKVEAEIQTLRTANVGLVEKVKELEAARTQAVRLYLTNMRSYEELVVKVEAKVKRLEKAGDWMANAAERYGIPYHSHAPEVWREAKGQP